MPSPAISGEPLTAATVRTSSRESLRRMGGPPISRAASLFCQKAVRFLLSGAARRRTRGHDVGSACLTGGQRESDFFASGMQLLEDPRLLVAGRGSANIAEITEGGSQLGIGIGLSFMHAAG